jgi:ubiquinone/menaquinone biosynthesis C-methylase UbiE
VDFRPGDRVLELGCGNGKTAAWLSARPVELHAIDFSPEAVNLCREAVRQAGGKADIRLMDGRKLLYPDGHFDIVICIHYLAHLKPEDRKKAAKEAERVLKPAGGMLIFREFGTGDFRSGKGRQLPEKRTFERKGIIIHYFTKKEVPRLFPGLKPQSVEIRRWKMCGFQREEVWAEFRKF